MVKRITKINRQEISQIAKNQQQIKWFEAIQDNSADLPDIAEQIAVLELEVARLGVTSDESQISANQALSLVANILKSMNQRETYQPASQVQLFDDIYQIPSKLPKQIFTLSSAFSSTSTTPATVTGWTAPVFAGGVYRITVVGAYQTVALTTGGILGISATSAAGTIVGSFNGAIAQTTASSNLNAPNYTLSGPGSNMATTGVTVINSPHFFNMDSVFTCTTSGFLNIQWSTEVAASAAQLNAGSVFIFERLK